ncbi:hypothetical protein HYALB_00004395 [Hymenoscyphus albidus]|uniref:Uncharacterized protein n=1 Tax=Hymenoscyphus albidus TaxID=595503 RepID=A0A9N9Q4M9_9HELO|nr:hypothetical protein HYALB_00004395 [Hymenoscyphus albidus]
MNWLLYPYNMTNQLLPSWKTEVRGRNLIVEPPVNKHFKTETIKPLEMSSRLHVSRAGVWTRNNRTRQVPAVARLMPRILRGMKPRNQPSIAIFSKTSPSWTEYRYIAVYIVPALFCKETASGPDGTLPELPSKSGDSPLISLDATTEHQQSLALADVALPRPFSKEKALDLGIWSNHNNLSDFLFHLLLVLVSR